MLNTEENAVLTILSTQITDDDSDSTELNTTAHFAFLPDRVEIVYSELDETGAESGETVISVLGNDLVSIHKSGFAEAVMILEHGKTHPFKYVTILGTMEMLLRTIELSASFDETGGRLKMRYLLDIGEQYSAENIIDLRVKLRDAV